VPTLVSLTNFCSLSNAKTTVFFEARLLQAHPCFAMTSSTCSSLLRSASSGNIRVGPTPTLQAFQSLNSLQKQDLSLSHQLNRKMGGLEELDELANDIREAYESECRIADSLPANTRRSSYDTNGLSIRDIEQNDEANEQEEATRKDMLEAWMHLIKALYHYKVYLQYAPSLEKLFSQVACFEKSMWQTAKVLLELMVETLDNNDKGTECRYVTLMEILSSYAGHWELSHQCEDSWVSAGKRPNLAASPEEFRIEAYGVLMSLKWVPNSQGLRESCGITDDAARDKEAPLVVQSIFHQIRSTPLPRHDCIHRILSRLKTGPNVTVAIASPHEDSGRSTARRGQGLGKTTLAAMVTSHPAVQSNFTVLWLRLNKGNQDLGTGMNYQVYVKYLDSLCEQLGVKPEWPKPLPGLDEASLMKKKEEEKMFQVKREMSSLLQQKSKGLLLVLDDVYDDGEIEWFWFMEDQSLLVTTLSQTLNVDWTLELEVLVEEEALELFLTEADYPPSHILRTSLEAKSIVQRCGYHPLTIRTVARWFRLKQVTAGVVKGLEELSQELSACLLKLRHSRSSSSKLNPTKILNEVMNLMLSPVLAAGGQPTTLMKMCLSSMAVVFPNEVPLEAVHLLWAQLLKTEPDAIHELGDNLTANQLRKRVRFISEALTSLGLLSIIDKEGTPYVEIHHEMQAEYAMALAREMQFSSSQSETARRWHTAFATGYLAKKVESDRDGAEDVCRSYALENLLHHMLKAQMYQKVAVLLRDERFLSERLDHMGWHKGTEIHLRDCKQLRVSMEEDDSVNADPVEVAINIYNKAAAFIADNATKSRKKQTAVDAAEALLSIGYVVSIHERYSDAILHYKAALKLAPKNSALSSIILYSLSTVFLAKHDHERGLKHLNECLKAMKECGDRVPLYAEALLTKGDALMTHCDYRSAMEFYDMALDRLFNDSGNNRVEIGIALGRKGRLYHVMGEHDNAYSAFDECLKWKKKINESSCDLASVYNFMGDICVERGEKEKAIEFFDKSYRIFEQFRSEADAADIHIINGKTDALHGDFEGCHESFDLAIGAMGKVKRPLMERTAYDLRCIARTLMDHGDVPAALSAFKECLEQTDGRKDDSLERSAALFDMGNLYRQRNETELAFQYFEQSLKIRIVKLGESDTVILTLEKIGELHRSVNENEDALKFFNKALELTERVHGEESEKVTHVLFNLGSLKAEMNEDVEALAMFMECLDLQRRNLPMQHPDIADTLEALGKMHMKQNKYSDAYHCFVEGLECRQASLGPDNPLFGDSFHLLGVVARKGNDCERALHFLLDALHVRKSLKDQGATVETLKEIGHVHRQLGDRESALGCYEKCLEILLDQFGEVDERIGDVLIPLGHVKKDLGLMDDAQECYKRALAVKVKKHGKDSIHSSRGHRSIGMLKFQLGEYPAAEKYLTDYIRIQDANKAKNSIEYVLALEMMGDMHRHKHDVDDANSAYSAAYTIFSTSKELNNKYPALSNFLESRLATGEDGEGTAQPAGIFSRITGEFGRLNEEVKNKGKIRISEEEEAFMRKILFDD
jgi:tetratricopeptide (TPR) repeat protein